MKNGSELTDAKLNWVEKIKKKYSNYSEEFEIEEVLEDCMTLINIVDSKVEKAKDPRITIELAKLRKENSSLKKELSKFFPDKDSIETASKKLESVFQIDSLSLLRYENSDLREKNERYLKQIDELVLQKAEIEKNFASDLANLEKLKKTCANLRVENSNFVMQNREISKRNKILEEQSQIVENLQKKLRGALMEADKGKNHRESNENSTQTEEENPKSSKLLARLANKKVNSFEICGSNSIFCFPRKKNELKIFKNIEKIVVFPKRPVGPPQISGIPQNIKTNKPKLYMESCTSITVLAKKIKKIIKLKLSKTISSSIIQKNRKKTIQLKVSKTTSASLVPKKGLISDFKPKEKISITCHKIVSKTMKLKQITENSIIISPKKVPQPKKRGVLKQAFELSISIVGIKKPLKEKKIKLAEKIVLEKQKIFDRAESEEIEVFNALTIYKPDLSVSSPIFIKINASKTNPKLVLESTSSLGCKKRLQKLKLSNFKIYNPPPELISLKTFPGITKRAKLEIVVLRKFTFVPENKQTDDEESKSPGNARKRNNRQPARKPAIEEYFNLTFQAVKMNFQDRDKIAGLTCEELQAKALQNGIQFNSYHDWVKEQFSAFAITAAKRPSIMVKK